MKKQPKIIFTKEEYDKHLIKFKAIDMSKLDDQKISYSFEEAEIVCASIKECLTSDISLAICEVHPMYKKLTERLLKNVNSFKLHGTRR